MCTADQDLPADDVVLACGIWGQQVAALATLRVPLVPVAHPYVHGPLRAPTATGSPFVRWPEHHVYARDHGDRLGLGSYAHAPIPVDVKDFGSGAELPWRTDFDTVIGEALALLPPRQRFDVRTRLNGVFSMTADNLPLLGPVDHAPGMWVAQALWVTHAAGAARCLAQAMTGQPPRSPAWRRCARTASPPDPSATSPPKRCASTTTSTPPPERQPCDTAR